MSPARKAALRGWLFGWCFGMLLWTVIVVVVTAPTTDPRYEDRVWEWSGFFHGLRVAPIWGLLFTLPGAVVGFIAGKMRSWVPSVGAMVGAAIGATLVIASSPPNGWLTLSVPLPALLGGVLGTVIAANSKAAANRGAAPTD